MLNVPWFQNLGWSKLVIPVSSVAGEREFILQINIRTDMRRRLTEANVQNFMTIASEAIPLETFDYTSWWTIQDHSDEEDDVRLWVQTTVGDAFITSVNPLN